MPERVRGKLLVALWAIGICCLGGLGCQAQFSFLGGPLASSGSEGNGGRGIQVTDRHSGSTAQEVVHTSYQTADQFTGQPVPPPLPRVSVMPNVQGSGPLSTLPDVQSAEGGSQLPDVQPAEGTPAAPLPLQAVEESSLPLPTQKSRRNSRQATGTLRTSAVEVSPGEVPLLGAPVSAGPHLGSPGGGQDGAGPDGDANERPLPTELSMVSHPPYMIEPPDILLIDAVRIVPRPPYTVQPLDVLLIRVSNTLTNQPIDSFFTVGPDGTINLGFTYGSVRIAGMTLETVQETLRRHLGRVLKEPQVAVALAQFRGVQQLRGEHLVRQDGTISLGTYGCVYVTGLTICQAKAAIERHLKQFLQDPEISVDVFAYNSKVYYIITDGAGFGQQVYRLPITGKETVLDAIGTIQGLPAVASKRHIWVARPAPANHGCTQILPVDWRAITEGASTCTNYQIFPGDRIYVKADCLISIDNALAKILSPIERLFGITLLGTTTVQSFRTNGNGNGVAAAAVAIP